MNFLFLGSITSFCLACLSFSQKAGHMHVTIIASGQVDFQERSRCHFREMLIASAPRVLACAMKCKKWHSAIEAWLTRARHLVANEAKTSWSVWARNNRWEGEPFVIISPLFRFLFRVQLKRRYVWCVCVYFFLTHRNVTSLTDANFLFANKCDQILAQWIQFCGILSSRSFHFWANNCFFSADEFTQEFTPSFLGNSLWGEYGTWTVSLHYHSEWRYELWLSKVVTCQSGYLSAWKETCKAHCTLVL